MKNSTYDTYQHLSEHFTLLVDTREQQNDRYRHRMQAFEELGVHPLRQKLETGDYSAILELPNGHIVDFSEKIAIERKMDLEELLRCFGTNRSRFEAELLRAKISGCRLYVVTEGGSYEDIAAGKYITKISVASATGTYHAFEQRHNAIFHFSSPEEFPKYTYGALRRYIMDYLCKTYPNGEILKS